MVRLSKPARRRAISPRKCKAPSPKTGPKKDNLPQGYKPHDNAAPAESAPTRFIPRVG